jgi:V8-like Glu-specific endopeptidase
MPSRRLLAVVAVFTTLAIPVFAGEAAAGGPPADPGANSRHDQIVAHWTPERMRAAKPRDVEADENRGFSPVGKPGGGGGGGGGGSALTVLGASWTDTTTLVYKASGKVYFEMGGNGYICSGAVVQDNRTDYSLVLTAGHCAYDETGRAFATNWMFIPQFDSNPTYTCAQTAFGCWTAEALVVHSGYATAGAYNTQATVHDYAIAVVGPGGKSKVDQLDARVGAFLIRFSSVDPGTQTYAFGYPAAGQYGGSDLVYSTGKVQNDPLNNNLTYALGSDMTGGSSGGPWMTAFTAGAGTLTSVNSYTYRSVKNVMHGPKFDVRTQAVFSAADNAATLEDTIVP